ncbi:MAG: arylsulfatase [Rikenellaceae bacterium]
MRTKTTLLALSLVALAQCSNSKSEKPNVIFILADDIGYGDLGCYGAELIKTPNIDCLASEGRRFTDAHSGSAVSTPSRYAMLTGRYPFRGTTHMNSKEPGIWGPLGLNSPILIDSETKTVAQMMQEQGYATACIGKWHLGFTNEVTDWNEQLTPGPNQVGFDYYFGIPFVSSGPPYVFVRNDRVVGLDPEDPITLVTKENGLTPTPTPSYPNKGANRFAGGAAAHELYKDDELGMLMAQESVDWIKANKDNPFFLYLATPHIHHPFTPNEKFIGSSECGIYGDFVQEFDWVVGEVLNTLKEEGLDKNTLVIVTSDNGGMFNNAGQDAWDMGHYQNGDKLGFKFDVWEGGHSVPFIAKWPGVIKAGSVSNQVISSVDLFASLAKLTGYELQEGEAPDSYDMLDVITGDVSQDEMVRGALVLSSFRSSHMSLRDGEWVYIPGQGNGGWGGGRRGTHIFGGPGAIAYAGRENSDLKDGKIREDAPAAQLYNLAQDPNQTVNVIEKYPEIAEKMQAELTQIWASEQTRE